MRNTRKSGPAFVPLNGRAQIYSPWKGASGLSCTKRRKNYATKKDFFLNFVVPTLPSVHGSPIIQNGKLVGAVTHVLINDPTTGYGIFTWKYVERSTNAHGEGILKTKSNKTVVPYVTHQTSESIRDNSLFSKRKCYRYPADTVWWSTHSNRRAFDISTGNIHTVI